MTLQQFLNSKKFNSEINQILLNIESGSIKMYRKLNEETADIFGSSGQKNIQNEEVQKLDLIANDIFISVFKTNSNIAKILSEENARKLNPDYFFVMPYGFINEFIKREKKWLRSGGKFLLPYPNFKIVRNKWKKKH